MQAFTALAVLGTFFPGKKYPMDKYGDQWVKNA